MIQSRIITPPFDQRAGVNNGFVIPPAKSRDRRVTHAVDDPRDIHRHLSRKSDICPAAR
jgi:hypothetical protein